MFTFLSLLVLALSFAFVQALPTISRRDVSPGLLSQLEYLSQYSAAAYCTENNVPQSASAVTCDVGNCPLVQAAGATTLLEYQNLGPVDGTGFVAVDHSKQLIVLAFRGSKSIGNWLANVNIVQQLYPNCVLCTVHSGFYDTWKLVKPQVTASLASAVVAYPSYRIIATGHSLGGAVATIAVGDLRKSGYTVDLYAYGSPMVGNLAFVNYISSKGNNYRITHAEDLVPKLPGYALGYAHISNEYWITSPTGALVTTSDVQVSGGPFNLNGNIGTLGINVEDHGWYFGPISACGPEQLEFPKQ